MMKQQQEAYRVDGVDEDEPALDLKKRKAADLAEVRAATSQNFRTY